MKKLTISDRKMVFGYLAILLAAMLFGSVSTLAKPTLVNIDPLVLSFLVYLLASLVFTPLAYKTKSSLSKKDLVLVITIALSGAVAAPILYFVGLEQTTASDAALLSNGEIAFSILLAVLFFKERIERKHYAAIAMVLGGVIIVATNLQLSFSVMDLKNMGNILVLGATVFWALDNNISKIISKRVDVARIVQLKSLIGGAILLAVVLILQIPINVQLENIPNIVLLGTAGFGISIYLFIYGLKSIGTVKTVMIFSTSSVFGLLFARMFLNEQISYYQIIAVVIMIAGLYLLQKTK